jgi:hypothetical protein
VLSALQESANSKLARVVRRNMEGRYTGRGSLQRTLVPKDGLQDLSQLYTRPERPSVRPSEGELTPQEKNEI